MTTIESLSSLVTARSIRLSKCLGAKSHPDPTFDASGASRYAGEDAELRSARQDLVRAARDLASLAESPEDHILSLTWSSADAANLAVLVRFSLPQLVPLSSGISAADLASAADLPEDVVVRTMRYAVAKGIFEEAPAGRVFTHNASSALLAKNEHRFHFSTRKAGGSSGHTVLALSQTCPASMRFVIQDIDPVALEQGRAAVARLANGGPAADRFEFQMHNLFEKQTVRAGIYIFRHIFHDWPDADVVKMLKNLVPALDQGARILVSEGIVPEQAVGRANTLDDQLILIEDMVMLASHGAKERTAADFVGLFHQADPRLTYVGKTGGTNGAFQSLLEFKFEIEASAERREQLGVPMGAAATAVNGFH